MTQFITSNGLIQTHILTLQKQIGLQKNHTLLEMARTLIYESHASKCLWPETITTTNYLKISFLPEN